VSLTNRLKAWLKEINNISKHNLVDWHKLTYLVLTCRKTPINQSINQNIIDFPYTCHRKVYIVTDASGHASELHAVSTAQQMALWLSFWAQTSHCVAASWTRWTGRLDERVALNCHEHTATEPESFRDRWTRKKESLNNESSLRCSSSDIAVVTVSTDSHQIKVIASLRNYIYIYIYVIPFTLQLNLTWFNYIVFLLLDMSRVDNLMHLFCIYARCRQAIVCVVFLVSV